MKTTLALASLLATSALAKPLHELIHERLHHKRDWAVVEDIQTVYTTVTAGEAAPTPASEHGGWSWGSWGGWHGPSSVAPAATTSAAPAPVPVVTEEPLTTTMTWAAPTPPAPAEASSVAWSSAPAAPAPSASSSPSQGTGPGGVDIASLLDQHNNHRQNASVPALVWSTDMANIAAQIAASCVYAHNTQAGGGGYGQNIGAGAPPQDIPAMITNEMYNGEINFYPQPYGVEPDMSNFEQWGHYSQIVWKNTVSVGCAVQDCSSQGLSGVGSGVSPFFAVCNYSPPGNFGGEYGANVLPPNGGLPTDTVANT